MSLFNLFWNLSLGIVGGIVSSVVVSRAFYMVSEHDNRKDQKEFFLKGYNEMLRQIEPEKIICYNTPFPEMQGDIVLVDYERSFWKHMDEDSYIPSKYAKYICGEKPIPVGSHLIIKSGYVVNENDGNYNSIIQAGMGSATAGSGNRRSRKMSDFLGNREKLKFPMIKKGIG